MVDTQHFCLRWNNYQSSITSAFENLRDDEDFVDVTLACDGRSLKAHRVVLSACSPYFRELLKSTPCKHPVIVLQDVAFTDLHALVEFIYHGEVNVHQRSLSSFLKTAEVLRVSGLTQQQAEETHNLAQVQSVTNSGSRTPVNHHQSFTDKLVEDALFPQAPSPHLNNLHHPSNVHSGATVNQLLRRAAQAAALRRERNNSNHSDELSLKRHRLSNDANSGLLGNNNNLDTVNQHMPQITAADFSTSLKHNNNLSPHIKDQDRHDSNKTPHGNNNNSININNNTNSINNNNNNNNNNSINIHNKDNSNTGGLNVSGSVGNVGGVPGATTNGSGGGSLGSTTDKESLTPSPPARSADDVKSEPMELVCGSNQDNENSNDSVGDHDLHHHSVDEKGSLSSPHDDDLESSIHSHTAPPFFSPADSKLFSTPGSFNFSMAALADPSGLGGFPSQALQNASDLGSPQGLNIGRPSSPCGSGGGSGNRLQLPLPLTACHRCDVCGKLLSTKLTLKRHKEQQHLQPLNNAICNLCHKVFRTLNSLNNHKSIYHRRQKQHQPNTNPNPHHQHLQHTGVISGGQLSTPPPSHHHYAAMAAQNFSQAQAQAVVAAAAASMDRNEGMLGCDRKNIAKLEFM